MKGILFGTKHSYDDFGLILTNKSIGLPTPKTSSISVVGRDGDIDTSELLTGDIKFNNRKLEFEFVLTDDYDDFNVVITQIASSIHGRKLQIILDDDSDYYYYGRCEINEWNTNKRIGKIAITCDCEPYKYTISKLSKTVNVVNSTNVQITGKRMRVNPTIETSNVTGQLTLRNLYDNKTYSMDQGTYNFVDLFIREGLNTFEITGSGIVKFSYDGGDI